MGNTRDLFKKIRDTKGIFHAKMGTIKDRNVLTEAEDMKKRWQEYTEELYKKDLHDPDNHDVWSLLIDYAKAFACVDHNKLWKILKEMRISDHLTYLWKTYMQVRKQLLELEMEQQTGSK